MNQRRINFEEYIGKFHQGTHYMNIVSAVTKKELTTVNDVRKEYLEKKCVKFIPASGAATRC